MIEFSEKDFKQLIQKGITKEKIEHQIKTFMEGIPFVQLEAPAVIKNGIRKLTPKQEKHFIDVYEASMKGLTIIKFVPASGAASRMFKSLFNFLETFDPGKQDLQEYLKKSDSKDLTLFFNRLEDFPFYDMLQKRLAVAEGSERPMAYDLVQELLSEEGLNYGFYPKGLLPFHNYETHAARPFEEHLLEAALYASTEGKAYLHFTISEQHQTLFDKEWERIKDQITKRTGNQFQVSYSYQKSSTDTLAVTLENEPFRTNDGKLLFRPGGHGALIENLNEQDADIIFIKNIDNTVTADRSKEVAAYKKMLAGILLETQKKVFQWIERIEEGQLNGEELEQMKSFLEKELNVRFPDRFSGFTLGQQIEILKDKLERPLRVCGMVRNEGEPGGGPFWVKDSNGNISLQIVEAAQVAMDNTLQAGIFKRSTHFNPVDLVCGVRDHKGRKYDLLNYRDEKQGFITQKTQEGKALKALELPGLWNGAMAYWNTIFVEVPSATFNPVKTVNDLLKPAHQPGT